MEQEERESLAERLLAAGALRVMPGGNIPLLWSDERLLADEELRRETAQALAALVREHYPAGEAILGDAWGIEAAAILGLPYAPEMLPERIVLVADSTAGIEPWLPTLTGLRKAGSSPAVAVIWNGREEDLRLRLDREDIRCHWLTDLECGAAAALRAGILDFDDYCRMLPQD